MPLLRAYASTLPTSSRVVGHHHRRRQAPVRAGVRGVGDQVDRAREHALGAEQRDQIAAQRLGRCRPRGCPARGRRAAGPAGDRCGACRARAAPVTRAPSPGRRRPARAAGRPAASASASAARGARRARRRCWRGRRSWRRWRRRRAAAGRGRARRSTLSSVGEPLEDRVLVVAQHEELDRDGVRGGGPEGGDRVLRGALAEHAHDLALGLRELHAERRREAEAEAAAGAEVVGAGAREAQVVAQRGGARRRLEHDDAVRRGTAPRAACAPRRPRAARPAAAPRARSARAAARGRRARARRVAVGRPPPARAASSSRSARSVSATSATIASPIGARAASSGSLVIATSSAPSARKSPGMLG